MIPRPRRYPMRPYTAGNEIRRIFAVPRYVLPTPADAIARNSVWWRSIVAPFVGRLTWADGDTFTIRTTHGQGAPGATQTPDTPTDSPQPAERPTA